MKPPLFERAEPARSAASALGGDPDVGTARDRRLGGAQTLDGALAIVPVYLDHAGQTHGPPEQRHSKKLLLGDEAHAAPQSLKYDGDVVVRLMIGHQHERLPR